MKQDLRFSMNCDGILQELQKYQDKIDSSPVWPRNKPKFKDVYYTVVGDNDIDYCRALYHELISNQLIIINIVGDNLDGVFHRNVITNKGFNFLSTTSFVSLYKKKRNKDFLNKVAVNLGIIAALVSAIYSALTYYKPDIDKNPTIQNSKEHSQKYISKPKPLAKIQLKDSTTSPKMVHQ